MSALTRGDIAKQQLDRVTEARYCAEVAESKLHHGKIREARENYAAAAAYLASYEASFAEYGIGAEEATV